MLDMVSFYSWAVFCRAAESFRASVVLLMTTLPMLFVSDEAAAMPLNTLLMYMFIGQVAALIICHDVEGRVLSMLCHRDMMTIGFEHSEKLGYQCIDTRNLIIMTIAVMLVTALVQALLSIAMDLAVGRLFCLLYGIELALSIFLYFRLRRA